MSSEQPGALTTSWRVTGSYFEACNCEAVCPCRRQGGRPGGAPTYEVCDFALSWRIVEGRSDALDLSGLTVVMVGSFNEPPGQPAALWRVVLYVDDRAREDQHEVLARIFLGRAGGTTLRNFGRAIGEVYAVRPARITLDHRREKESIEVEDLVRVKVAGRAPVGEPVSCGIPGFDRPGEEVVTEIQMVNEPPLRWEVSGRCGFVSDFAYSSQET